MRYFVFKNTNICHRFLICCGIASLAILFVSSHAFADVTYSDTDPENPIPTGNIVIGPDGVGNVTFDITDIENASSVAGISGTGTITKNGAGTLVYSVATTYTGDTVINGGTIRLDGAAGSGKLFNGTITIAAGASMVCNKHDTLGYNANPANTFNIYGTLDNAVQNESLRNTVFNMYGGTISCTSGGTLDVLADTVKFRAHALDGATAEAPTVSTISGKINFRVTGEIEFGADANSVLQLKDVVTGGGTPDFLKTGAGTVEFTKLPNYPGTTTVREGTLKISVSPGNSKFFKGEVTINAGATLLCGIHDSLGYNNGTANTFNIYGTLDNAAGNESLRNTTFNMYGATISSSGGGYLDILQENVKFWSHALEGATAENPTVSTISSQFRMRVDDYFEIETDANTTLQLTNKLIYYSGTGGIHKTGPGTLTMTGANEFTKGVTISAGTLQINGTATQTPLGRGGTVTVQNGATLLVNYSTAVRLQGQTINVENGGKIDFTSATSNNNDFRLYTSALNVAEGGTVNLRLLSVGNGGTGSTATIDGGSMTLTANAYVGNDGEDGTLTLNSGTLKANSSFTVGQYKATGTYNQNGGTATIGNLVVGNSTSVTPNGIVNMADGTLNVTTTTIGAYNSTNGYRGKGFVSQTGGTFTTQTLTLGDSDAHLVDGKTDLMELSGGTLAVTTLKDPSGYFTMTGGKLVFQKNGSTNPSVSKDLTVEGGTVQVDGPLTVGGTYTQTGGELRLTDDNLDKITAAGLNFTNTSLLIDTENEYALGDTIPLSKYLMASGDENTFDFSQMMIEGTDNYWNLTLLNSDTLLVFGDRYDQLPEPSTWALLLLGVAGLLYWRKK